ncbi:MAG: hypothetical protein CMJ47_03820 [Planctomyces sp.]|nr:hypothetical protein [Planctomyces sp.]
MNSEELLNNSLGIALLVATFGIIAAECRRDIRQLVSAKCVFLLTISAWFLLEAVLAPRDLHVFSQVQYDFGIVCVALALVSFLCGYGLSKGGAFDPLFRRLSQIDNPRVIWGLFLFACAAGFTPLLVVAKGDVTLILEDAFVPRARWSSVFQRGRYGGFRDAFLELQMFLRAAVPLASAIAADRRQTGSRKLLSVAFLTYAAARAFNSGTRSQVAEVFLPIAAAVYWRMSGTAKKYALIFGLPVVTILALIYSAAAVIGRNDGTVDWENAAQADYVGFEMFREVLFITKAVPDQFDYKLGRTYYVQAVNPIPRAIWTGKPIDDAGLELAKLKGAVAGGDAYMTVSPGLIGEMYWNFGIPGIIVISGLLGYLAKSWDRVRPLASKSLIAFTIYAAGLAIIFLSGRSINMATLYGMIALYALLIVFSQTSRRAASAGGV